MVSDREGTTTVPETTRQVINSLDKRTITYLFTEGLSVTFIAQKYGVSRRTISRILADMGHSLMRGRPPKLLDHVFEKLYKEYKSGVTTLEELANRHGISVSTIKRRIRKHERYPGSREEK